MRLRRPHRIGRVLAAAGGLALAASVGAETASPASGSERLDEVRAELERLEASVQALRRALEAYAEQRTESEAQPVAAEPPDAMEPPPADLEGESELAVQSDAAEPDAEQVPMLEEPLLQEQAGESPPAEQEAPRFVALDPPLVMLRQGRQAFQDREFYAAEQKFREFLGRYPRHAEALSVRHWLGETLYEQGDYQAAIEAFGEVLEHGSGPRRLVAHLKTGYAWYELGEYEKARAALTEVQAEDPNGSLGRLAQLRLERLERQTGAQ